MRKQDRIKKLRDRLALEELQILYEIDEAVEVIERLSAGKIYSAYGASAVNRLDELTQAEEALSAAIGHLDRTISEQNELAEAQ